MRNFTILLIVLASPAAGEVRSVSPSGFELVNMATVTAPPEKVYAALGTPARWWSKGHTYSGNSANMTMVLKAGGCFCEVVPADGSTIEHGQVVYARPGKALRLHAALGPLQQEGVSAALTFALKPVGAGTEVTMTYVVGGFVRGGADTFATAVDGVMAEQLHGLQQLFAGP